ncbi:flagellar assembly protein FliW [bacterium]|nr:flagellar assembly protein FliW [bacterium]
MKFRTTRFGELEYGDEVVMHFPEGVLGFPESKRYILLEHNAEGSPFKWLQSLDNPDLAFIVIDPFQIAADYRFDIDLDTERIIGTNEASSCALMAISNIPRDAPLAMTANLKAPLLVNVETRRGRQVILTNNFYQINTPVFPTLSQMRGVEPDEAQELERAVS